MADDNKEKWNSGISGLRPEPRVRMRIENAGGDRTVDARAPNDAAFTDASRLYAAVQRFNASLAPNSEMRLVMDGGTFLTQAIADDYSGRGEKELRIAIGTGNDTFPSHIFTGLSDSNVGVVPITRQNMAQLTDELNRAAVRMERSGNPDNGREVSIADFENDAQNTIRNLVTRVNSR